jgi:myo-inositol-1(or 4)-monophosphatase
VALDPVYLATAIEAALDAGRIQRTAFRRPFEVSKKGVIDLVTEIDLAVERNFRELIALRFPSHAVLGEEGPLINDAPRAEPSPWRWIIDPIDGTTNFAHGIALFCVSIALEVEGRVEVGVVYDPIGEELFTAERGVGAWLNGLPIAVSSRAELIDALLCTGFPYTIRDRHQELVAVFADFLARARAVRRLGSAALDLCYVAAGRFDGFWEAELHPWDTAAAALVVEEAGGRVTGYQGQAFSPFNGQIVASNGRLHDDMLAVLRAASAQ